MVGDLAAKAASAVVASAVQATPFVTSIACAKRSGKNKFVLENLGGFPTCNSGRFIRRPYQPPSLYPSFVPNVLCKTKFDSETLRRRLPARWSPPPYRRAPRPVSSHKTTHTHTQTYTHTHTRTHTHTCIHTYTHNTTRQAASAVVSAVQARPGPFQIDPKNSSGERSTVSLLVRVVRRMGVAWHHLRMRRTPPGGNPQANLESISHICYLREVASEWNLTKETIYFPLRTTIGC